MTADRVLFAVFAGGILTGGALTLALIRRLLTP